MQIWSVSIKWCGEKKPGCKEVRRWWSNPNPVDWKTKQADTQIEGQGLSVSFCLSPFKLWHFCDCFPSKNDIAVCLMDGT